MAVPKLRFKGFEGEWEERKLGEIAEIKDSARISNEFWITKGIPYLRSSDLVNEDLKGELFISKETYDKYALKTGAPQKDDVLFTSGGKVGVVYHKEDNSHVYVQGGAILYVRTSTSENLDGSFLSVFFSSPKMKKYMENASVGGTIKHFTLKPANATPIIFPSIKEQQKIGSFFKKFYEKIKLQQEKIDLLKEQKKGFMEKIFSQELRFKDGDGQEFPKWTTNILTHFALVNPKSEELKPEFRYIDLEAVADGELLSTQVISKHSAPSRAQRVVRKGDILYQTVRPYQKNNLLYNHDFSDQVVASTGYAQIKAKENTDSAFLYQLMNTEKFTCFVLQRCTGTSYPAINSSDLGEIEIQMPVLKEQQKIAIFLSKFDEKITNERNKLENLYHQKHAFMQLMFS